MMRHRALQIKSFSLVRHIRKQNSGKYSPTHMNTIANDSHTIHPPRSRVIHAETFVCTNICTKVRQSAQTNA